MLTLTEARPHRRSTLARFKAARLRDKRAVLPKHGRSIRAKLADRSRSNAMRRGNLAGRIAALAASLDQPARLTDGTVLKHPAAYVAAVVETAGYVAEEVGTLDAAGPREFAKHFLDRDANETNTPVGLAAVLFEAYLLQNEESLYSQFLETYLEPGDQTFLAIFEGPILREQLIRLVESVRGFMEATVLVRHGDRSEHEVSDLTILECRPLPEGIKAMGAQVKPAAGDGRAQSPTLDKGDMHPRSEPGRAPVGPFEALRPTTLADYQQIAAEGGTRADIFEGMFGAPEVRPYGIPGHPQGLTCTDLNGVSWVSSDQGRTWLPELVSAQHVGEAKRLAVKVTADTGDSWTTEINADLAGAKKYFVGQRFNIGTGGNDRMVKAVKVEPVPEEALGEATRKRQGHDSGLEGELTRAGFRVHVDQDDRVHPSDAGDAEAIADWLNDHGIRATIHRMGKGGKRGVPVIHTYEAVTEAAAFALGDVVHLKGKTRRYVLVRHNQFGQYDLVALSGGDSGSAPSGVGPEEIEKDQDQTKAFVGVNTAHLRRTFQRVASPHHMGGPKMQVYTGEIPSVGPTESIAEDATPAASRLRERIVRTLQHGRFAVANPTEGPPDPARSTLQRERKQGVEGAGATLEVCDRDDFVCVKQATGKWAAFEHCRKALEQAGYEISDTRHDPHDHPYVYVYESAEAVTEEPVPASSDDTLTALRRIVKTGQHGGVPDPVTGRTSTVDATSAQAILAVHDGLTPTNRARLIQFSIPKMVDLAFKTLARAKAKTTTEAAFGIAAMAERKDDYTFVFQHDDDTWSVAVSTHANPQAGYQTVKDGLTHAAAEKIAQQFVTKGSERLAFSVRNHGHRRTFAILTGEAVTERKATLKAQDPAAQHQEKVALKTLRMPAPMRGVMGGPNLDQAKAILKRLGYTDQEIATLGEDTDPALTALQQAGIPILRQPKPDASALLGHTAPADPADLAESEQRGDTLLSVADLSEFLKAQGVVDQTFTAVDLRKRTAPKHVSDETFGSKSYVFVRLPDLAARQRLEQAMQGADIAHNPGYNKGVPTVSIRVKYFRGYHWDEAQTDEARPLGGLGRTPLRYFVVTPDPQSPTGYDVGAPTTPARARKDATQQGGKAQVVQAIDPKHAVGKYQQGQFAENVAEAEKPLRPLTPTDVEEFTRTALDVKIPQSAAELVGFVGHDATVRDVERALEVLRQAKQAKKVGTKWVRVAEGVDATGVPACHGKAPSTTPARSPEETGGPAYIVPTPPAHDPIIARLRQEGVLPGPDTVSSPTEAMLHVAKIAKVKMPDGSTRERVLREDEESAAQLAAGISDLRPYRVQGYRIVSEEEFHARMETEQAVAAPPEETEDGTVFTDYHVWLDQSDTHALLGQIVDFPDETTEYRIFGEDPSTYYAEGLDEAGSAWAAGLKAHALAPVKAAHAEIQRIVRVVGSKKHQFIYGGPYTPGRRVSTAWDGGSRDEWYVVTTSGRAERLAIQTGKPSQGDPFGLYGELPPWPSGAVAVVEAGIFMGKPATPKLYSAPGTTEAVAEAGAVGGSQTPAAHAKTVADLQTLLARLEREYQERKAATPKETAVLARMQQRIDATRSALKTVEAVGEAGEDWWVLHQDPKSKTWTMAGPYAEALAKSVEKDTRLVFQAPTRAEAQQKAEPALRRLGGQWLRRESVDEVIGNTVGRLDLSADDVEMAANTAKQMDLTVLEQGKTFVRVEGSIPKVAGWAGRIKRTPGVSKFKFTDELSSRESVDEGLNAPEGSIVGLEYRDDEGTQRRNFAKVVTKATGGPVTYTLVNARGMGWPSPFRSKKITVPTRASVAELPIHRTEDGLFAWGQKGEQGYVESVDEATAGHVGVFLTILSSALTQYDMRASKRKGYNPNALAHYLGAVGRVRAAMKGWESRDDAAALDKLAVEIQDAFAEGFPPMVRTLKQIAAFKDTGKLPTLLVRESEGDALTEPPVDFRPAPYFVPADVDYTDGPVETQACEACTHFTESGCTLVQEAVAPKGHCAKWEGAPTLDEAKFPTYTKAMAALRAAVSADGTLTNVAAGDAVEKAGVPGHDRSAMLDMLVAGGLLKRAGTTFTITPAGASDKTVLAHVTAKRKR